MNSNIRASLTEHTLAECIDLLEAAGINTIEEIRLLKIGAVSRIFVDDDLAERFNDWRSGYREERAPFFFERLNSDSSAHHLSVVARVDMNEATQPVISTVETVLMEHLLAASTEYVPMVSLIGGTGSGKSFLSSSFMPEGPDSALWPTVAEVDQTVPTTAHVCVFKGVLRVGTKRSINLVDLEGEGGATPKTFVRNLAGMAQAAASSFVANTPGINHFLQLSAATRGKIIKHTMPRMAYLLSDVVIFVDTYELRREEFKERVKSFALEAHKSCNSVGWRPALILISNRWSPPRADAAGVDQTSRYESIVAELMPLFSQVALMRIPCANAFRTNPVFVSECIDQLHQKIDEFIAHVQQVRVHHKCLYAEKKTWYLFREVVKWVHRDPYGKSPIKSLAELYENAVHKSSVDNCLKALEMYDNHLDNSEIYLRNVSNVLRWYAYLAACDRKLNIQGETDPAALHNTVLKHCYATEQCTATLRVDGRVYHCRQNCQGHDDNHSNPAVVHEPAQNLLWRIFGGTDKVPVRWAGRFHSAVKPKEHSKEFFLGEINKFANLSKNTLVASFSTLQPQDVHTKALILDICGLCLTSYEENSTFLARCHHVLCENCVSKRKQLASMVTGKPLTCRCPFCRVKSPCPTFVPEEFVGSRVLSLDGGGVKGLVEVKIMQKIEKFFHPLKITNLFDVIVGTSAGGIIAMALQKHVPLERIAHYLEHMATQVLDVNGLVFCYRVLTNQPTCDTKAMEDAMKEMLGSNSNFTHNNTPLQPPHIFCTSYDTNADKTVLFGNLRALNRVSTPEERDHLRVGTVYSGRLWEAARATSAAPIFFSPFYLSRQDGTTRTLVDGGVGGANCPAHLAMRVAKVLQRHGHGAQQVDGKVDMCLSLGTGGNAPNLSGQTANGLTWAGKFIDSALDSERTWREVCANGPEFAMVKDRIRINPPNLGSLNAFASASIPLLHKGMEAFFQTAEAVQQMDVLYHTMYAKVWHVRAVNNPVIPVPFKFGVELRDLRLDFNTLEDSDLRRIVVSRGGAALSAQATHAQLVAAAQKAYAQKPVVTNLNGHFGCTFHGAEYRLENGPFTIPTAGLTAGAVEVDVYWLTETGHRTSVSGFPTFWNVLGEP